jgi:hypothetical protein
MKIIKAIILSLVLSAICGLASADETIVFIRHAEKPKQGLGQLSCQGLQRSLMLPAVLHGQFGKPTAIFAPNPSIRKNDKGAMYDYIRPLATIEPTAIQDELPVNADLGFKDIDSLQKALTASQFANATVFVAWEHYFAMMAARGLMTQFGGDPESVPQWDAKDFDSIYVVHLTTQADGSRKATFTLSHQTLNGLPKQCPGQ